jgi:hypothetical protein
MKSIVNTLGTGVLLCFSGLAAGAPDRLPTAALELIQKYPGVRTETIGDRVSMVYGRPMNKAATALAAADAFVAEDAAVFGAGRPTVSLSRVNELMSSNSTVVVYDQTLDGLPVERGVVRVVVKGTLEGQVVAMANARLAATPEGGFRPDRLDAQQAIAAVTALPEFAAMQEFGVPTMVVYAGEGDEVRGVEAVRAWKFWGAGAGVGAVPLKRTFFVDASNGNLAFARDAILHGTQDVSGTVKGWGSPGLLPDLTANPPALLDMPEIRATITGGNNALADVAGAFVINNALGGPLTVTSTVAQGRWVAVQNDMGAELSASAAGITPPGPANIILNPTPGGQNSQTTSQVNAFVHQTLAHNYFRDRAPSFIGLDIVVPANVNLNDTCNAFFDTISLTTNFFVTGVHPTQPSITCVNSAYSSVVAHEYGHFIVNRLDLAQGAFGEGYSDTVAMMVYDDGIIARNFRMNDGSPIRNPEAANIQYPCSGSCGGAPHCCGQIIGGVVWDMRNNFVTAYGQPTGIELLRQLHVDWSQITGGGIGVNSAHPQTAVEWLTVDDNDADLNNGTPNYALICEAFGQHSIACPAVVLIDFVYPSGQPATVSPFGTTTLQVDVVPVSGAPEPGTGVFFYNVNGGAFTSIPMTETSPNSYEVNFPATPCGSAIGYYVQAGIQGGGLDQDPFNAPIESFGAVSATGLVTTVDSAESNTGWNLSAPGDTASTGQWVFGNPNGTAAQPEDDQTTDPGVNCFFTGQGTPGGTLGEADVDGGITTLLSPVIDLSATPGATISYWRWYSNDTGGDPNNDTFDIAITNDGTNFVAVETIGPAGIEASGGWFFHSFVVSNFVAHSSTVRVRFIASDLSTGSLIEAAIDDFRVETVECAPPPGCLGDANLDGEVNFLDVTTVLANFGGAGPQGDADFDGDVDFSDVTTVLANFLAVCE